MLRELIPLPYHHAVAAILERENPRAFASLLPRPSGASDDDLLRHTYLLEPGAHPRPHDALTSAATALGLSVPVQVHAAGHQQGPNAELVFAPDRAIVVISGSLLELLDDEELTAVMGHELAHHVLWCADEGRHLAATRLLDAAEHDGRTPSEYLETARRLRLATELYADRGALTACGRLEPAIRGLLKVSTGLRDVDAASYLRQASEISFATTASTGRTHPETVLRAWALQHWVTGESLEQSEREIAAAIGARCDLSTMDLVGQDELAAITHELVRQATFLEQLRTPEALTLVERYDVIAPPSSSPLSEVGRESLAGLPRETRRYLCAVLTDLATATDDDLTGSLAAAVAFARRKDLGEDLMTFLSDELELADRNRRRLIDDADRLAAAEG
ncbi:hypothetical protein BH09ACT12_BH09ACT12_16360 [soil metagenome]